MTFEKAFDAVIGRSINPRRYVVDSGSSASTVRLPDHAFRACGVKILRFSIAAATTPPVSQAKLRRRWAMTLQAGSDIDAFRTSFGGTALTPRRHRVRQRSLRVERRDRSQTRSDRALHKLSAGCR